MKKTQTPAASSSEGLLRLEGRLDAASASGLWRRATDALDAAPLDQTFTVDASGLEYCDGAGIGLLLELRRRQTHRGGQIEIIRLAPRFQRLLDQFPPEEFDRPKPPARPRASAIEELGRAASEIYHDACAQIAFVGELLAALIHAAFHPRTVRWRDVLLVMETAGANAVPLVLLIGFIIGLVMAFQAAVIMRLFGVEIFVADLVALTMFRELGPLMTAIVLAGRSSSAFAAELGAMQINEEINALTTMGINPMRFLVVTRVAAATLIIPLLTILNSLMGLVGGAVVLLSMGTPLIAYLNQVAEAVDLYDLSGGLFKSVVFGFLVAAVGCLRGLQTRSGASAVGVSTTSAVVSGIVLIALADAVFAVVFYRLGI